MRPRSNLPFLSPLLALALTLTSGCGTEIAAATTGTGEFPPGPDGGVPTIDAGDAQILPSDVVVPPTDADFCSGSGSIFPIPGANTKCVGDIGATTFLFAVCACRDVAVSGNLLTDSLPATDGGSAGNGGSIGANGAVDTNSMLRVNGSVWAQASGVATALHVKQASTIFGDVHAGADVVADQPLTIADNLYVNGNVTGTVSCSVADVPTGFAAPGLTASGGVVSSPAPFPTPPCDCVHILDVASIVAAASTTATSDSANGLSPASFASFPAAGVTLPCGQYYFEGVGGGPVNLTIAGRAAVFVKGDFNATSSLKLTLAPSAELDLFVSGNLLLGDATLGSPTSPARVRVYVGGTNFNLAGTATIGANIYAPNADVLIASDFNMAGSLFVGSLQLSGAFTIHYDETILSTTGCAPSDGSCNTCHDCTGATPACISGTCAPCRTDSDCCAPLRCSQGRCYDQIP
jgi:hypothetical protein